MDGGPVQGADLDLAPRVSQPDFMGIFHLRGGREKKEEAKSTADGDQHHKATKRR